MSLMLAPNERCLEALTHANRTDSFERKNKWCTGEYKVGRLPKSKEQMPYKKRFLKKNRFWMSLLGEVVGKVIA